MEAPVMKSLPQSIEAEQSVLGAMIIDRTTIAQAAEVLNKDSFYRDAHKVIFQSNNRNVPKRSSCRPINSFRVFKIY